MILVLFCLIILNGSLSYAKEDTIDLGETGFTAQVQVKETGKDYFARSIANNIPPDINIRPLKLY